MPANPKPAARSRQGTHVRPIIKVTKEITWSVPDRPWEVVVEVDDLTGIYAFCGCENVATEKEADAAIASLKAEARAYLRQQVRQVG